jgi:hypothetical protein
MDDLFLSRIYREKDLGPTVFPATNTGTQLIIA